MAKDKEQPSILPERLAARLWHQRQWRLARRTLDGRRLRVLYPGRPSGGPGPDFQDALVQIQGSPPVQGDIEVHRRAVGWSQHGHDRDARYNNVVLHVVVQPGGEPAAHRQDGHLVPATELPAFASGTGTETSYAPLLPRLRRWRSLSMEQLGRLLDQAGKRRFQGKRAEFLRDMGREDPDEVVYRGVLEALGYSRNREPMRNLAQRLPWRTLRKTAGNFSLPDRAAAVRGLLLAVAGLTRRARPGAEGEAGVPGPVNLEAYGLVPMEAKAWCFAGTRPVNQPHRRLEWAAAFLARRLGASLVAGLVPLAKEKEIAPMLRVLTAANGGAAVLGRDRALDMVVNVLLPGLSAWGTMRADQALARSCLALYDKTPSLAENEITREMEGLLGIQGAGVAKGAVRQQGLLHLYQVLLRAEAPARPPGVSAVREVRAQYFVLPRPRRHRVMGSFRRVRGTLSWNEGFPVIPSQRTCTGEFLVSFLDAGRALHPRSTDRRREWAVTRAQPSHRQGSS